MPSNGMRLLRLRTALKVASVGIVTGCGPLWLYLTSIQGPTWPVAVSAVFYTLIGGGLGWFLCDISYDIGLPPPPVPVRWKIAGASGGALALAMGGFAHLLHHSWPLSIGLGITALQLGALSGYWYSAVLVRIFSKKRPPRKPGN